MPTSCLVLGKSSDFETYFQATRSRVSAKEYGLRFRHRQTEVVIYLFPSLVQLEPSVKHSIVFVSKQINRVTGYATIVPLQYAIRSSSVVANITSANIGLYAVIRRHCVTRPLTFFSIGRSLEINAASICPNKLHESIKGKFRQLVDRCSEWQGGLQML